MSYGIDERDAWLDDVRRWYFGGTPPAADRDDAASATPALPAAAAGHMASARRSAEANASTATKPSATTPS